MTESTCRNCGIDNGALAMRCARCDQPLACPYCRQAYAGDGGTGLRHCFGAHLVGRGHLTAEQLEQAVARQRSRIEPVGQIALRMGMLTLNQLFLVLTEQRRRPVLFGELAVELGFIDRPRLAELLAHQRATLPSLGPILVQAGVLDERTAQIELERFDGRRG